MLFVCVQEAKEGNVTAGMTKHPRVRYRRVPGRCKGACVREKRVSATEALGASLNKPSLPHKELEVLRGINVLLTSVLDGFALARLRSQPGTCSKPEACLTLSLLTKNRRHATD